MLGNDEIASLYELSEYNVLRLNYKHKEKTKLKEWRLKRRRRMLDLNQRHPV